MAILNSSVEFFGSKDVGSNAFSTKFIAWRIGGPNSRALEVGTTPLAERTNKSSFAIYLNLFNALLTAGCVIPILFAALVTCFSLITASKTTNRLRSTNVIFIIHDVNNSHYNNKLY